MMASLRSDTCRPIRCKIVASTTSCSDTVTCGICRDHGKRYRVSHRPLDGASGAAHSYHRPGDYEIKS